VPAAEAGAPVQPLLAAAPIAIVLAGMVGLHWSAAVAGAAGLLAALVLALGIFDLAAATGLALPQALTGILAEALHATGVILWIILPALGLYELQRRTGAFDRIRATLTGLSDDRRLQALLIAWFFGLFMEGAAGFGTPVALAAPLLVGLGFDPVRAVALALIGHAAGVSFGAVGTPVITQSEITGLAARDIATLAALMHALLGIILVAAVARLASDRPLDAATFGWCALAAAAFLGPSLALATLAGPELPTLGGALIGGAVFAAILWRRGGGRGGKGEERAGTPGGGLIADLAPYLVVLGLVLATRLIAPLREALQDATLAWRLHDAFASSFQPLYHPGTLLLMGLLAGAALTGRAGTVPAALAAALRRLVPVAISLFVMLALSRIMVHSGMVDALAEAAARIGALWPLLAPAIGVLGTFVTGSATASNILFTEFQLSTAAALALPPAALAAAQSFGAAIGNVVAPHNIIAGSATVGIQGREGEVLARTVRACAVYTLAGGALLFGLLLLI
jgi:lactate permease